MLEMFEVGPCKEGYELGFLIGRRFSDLIRSRVAGDLILQHQLLPFAQTPQAQPLLQGLSSSNREKFPEYWNEMLGTAEGSGVSSLDIMLLNLRKEILPFLPELVAIPEETIDCSDILVVNDSMAVAAHNEDANVALVDHTYLIKATLSNGSSFTAYTYAGELPSCAFGFNSHGLAFTLNSVPPSKEEILAGGIGRNFISRSLLVATGIEDALSCIQTSNASVGHSYNLIDMRNRKILNMESASRYRNSVHAVGAVPFFHANMYLHLHVQQVQDENSIERQRRAALLSVHSPEEMLSLLGDSTHEKYPIYMAGPTLYTLCTVLIDLDKGEIYIFQGNPKLKELSHTFTVHRGPACAHQCTAMLQPIKSTNPLEYPRNHYKNFQVKNSENHCEG